MTADSPHTPGTDDGADDDGTDAALTWDGEGDVTHEPAPTRRRPAPRATPETRATPEPTATPATPAATATAVAPSQTSGFVLVTYGILAATYLFYAFGWLTTTTNTIVAMGDPLGDFMFQLGEVLAVASAPVWFGAVLLFTRSRKPIVRLLWLLLGLVVLLPVPFIMGV
jgi:hypothetical protein